MISTKTNLFLRACLTAMSFFSVLTPASAATFSIDEFSVIRANGNLVFRDTFGDGISPPSAPNFSNGNSGSYFVTGTAGAETGGKLSLDTSLGAILEATGRTGQVLVFDALLLTNIDPANTINGFKAGNTFIVNGLFDLNSLPTVPFEGFGIRLSDRGIGLADDQLDLFVRRSPINDLVIQFRRVDALNDLVTTFGSVLLDSSHDQILLKLSKLNAATDTVIGSYSYVDSGVAGIETAFINTADIFNGENVTRASFRAISPVPEPGAYAMMLAGLGLIGWAVRRRAQAA